MSIRTGSVSFHCMVVKMLSEASLECATGMMPSIYINERRDLTQKRGCQATECICYPRTVLLLRRFVHVLLGRLLNFSLHALQLNFVQQSLLGTVQEVALFAGSVVAAKILPSRLVGS